MTRDEIYKVFRILDTRMNARLTTAKHIMFVNKNGDKTLIITNTSDGNENLKVYSGKVFTRTSQNVEAVETSFTGTIASIYFMYEYVVMINKYYTWDLFIEEHGK